MIVLASRTQLGHVLLAVVLGCGGNLAPLGAATDAGTDVSGGGAGGGSGTSSSSVATGTTSGGSTTTGSGGSGGTVDWSACGGPGECSLRFKGCCEPCGSMADLGTFVGVNTKHVDAFRREVCPLEPPCLPCIAAPRPFFGARCTNGRCEPFDIRQVPEFSKCSTNEDCRLRKGLDCCECGSPGEWTSVSIFGQGSLTAAVCAPMTGCAECAPIPPAGLKAVCIMNHCDLAMGN